MGSKQIFRKVSLERLASPEQLDRLVQVTTPKGWIALLAVGLLLATALVWGLTGTISEKVTGQGILLSSGGVFEIVAPAAGRVIDIPVGAGDRIREGQVVAWVAQPEVLDTLERAKKDLEAAREEHAHNVEFLLNDMRLQRESLKQRADDLRQSIKADEDQLQSLEDRIAAQEQLMERGLLAKPTLLSTRQQHDQVEERLRSRHSGLAQIAVDELAIENKTREERQAGELRIEQAQAKVEQLQRDLNASSQVVSNYSGRVLEVMTEKGQIVGLGEPVLSLHLTGKMVQDLVAVIYVPSIHGKKVEPGMEINISPSTVAQEEYGMIVGKVTLVSSFPATAKGMLRVLKNQQLVGALAGGGAPYEIHAELSVDPNTPSKYRWTSSEGPPTGIESGTIATAFINTKTQRPIEKVLPLLRKWMGTS